MDWPGAYCLIFHVAIQEIPSSRSFLPAWRNDDHTASTQEGKLFISFQPPQWRMVK